MHSKKTLIHDPATGFWRHYWLTAHQALGEILNLSYPDRVLPPGYEVKPRYSRNAIKVTLPWLPCSIKPTKDPHRGIIVNQRGLPLGVSHYFLKASALPTTLVRYDDPLIVPLLPKLEKTDSGSYLLFRGKGKTDPCFSEAGARRYYLEFIHPVAKAAEKELRSAKCKDRELYPYIVKRPACDW